MTDPAGDGAMMPEQGLGGVSSGNPNMAAGEAAALRERAAAGPPPADGGLAEGGVAVQLSEQLAAVRDVLVGAFGDLVVSGFRGELTVETDPARALDVLRFCRDEERLRCELLADLSAVHWPGGRRVESAQETTGWPSYELGDAEGRIEVDYVLYSVTHNHRFRVRVFVPDDDPVLPTAVDVYGSANFMEREVFDFFGVRFDGHPNLVRIEMPDDWEGHPQRKDYPLGGVEVQYEGATVPPPDQRKY